MPREHIIMRASLLTALLLCTICDCSAAEGPGAAKIHRLDGTTITAAQAESFARKTLDAAHVTGARIVVLDRGHLVWSEAFGLRRRDPGLPMDRETTTRAASITKSVF